MDSVVRAIVVYVVLLAIFRFAGKRSLSEITTFDAVLLLIISEAIQQALLDGDESMTNAFLVVLTLVSMTVVMSVLSQRWPKIDLLVNDAPLLIMENGRPLQDRLNRVRVSEDDIMERARELWGIERPEQIKYAVLERGGLITVIPKRVGWSTAKG